MPFLLTDREIALIRQAQQAERPEPIAAAPMIRCADGQLRTVEQKAAYEQGLWDGLRASAGG